MASNGKCEVCGGLVMLTTCVVVPMLIWYDKILSHSVTHVPKTVEPKLQRTLES